MYQFGDNKMIIYYQKSTKKILSVVNSNPKKHLDDNQLKDELNSMFPDLENDVDVSRFEEDKKAECGGTWDPETNTQIAPKPNEPKPEHPDKNCFKELMKKFESGSATLAEVQEYLFKADLTRRITEDN